jgi:hypothetical protein
MAQVLREMAIRVRWLPLFLVLAGLASPRLEPFLAPLAPPLDFALSFRRHRHLSLQRSGKARALLIEEPVLPLEAPELSDYKRP